VLPLRQCSVRAARRGLPFAPLLLAVLGSDASAQSSPIALPFGPVVLDAATPFSFVLDLEALPPRPVLRISVDRQDLAFGDSVVCSGPQGETDGFGAAVNEEIDIWRNFAGEALGFPSREGVVCQVELRVVFGSGPYTLGITAFTLLPNTQVTGGAERIPGVAGQVYSPESVAECLGDDTCRMRCADFTPEGANFRFIDAGEAEVGTCVVTGAANFGAPFEYQQDQPGTGGWDCCTWRFDGIDGVASEIGQIVLQNDGTPPPPDGDSDGILDPCDNCPADANGPLLGTCMAGSVGQECLADGDCGAGGDCEFDQRDTDADGIGDVCEQGALPDGDGDGVADPEDNCPTVPNGPAQAGVAGIGNQADSGGVASPADPNGATVDGRGDACQCGDVSGDGKVLGNDATLIRRRLLNLSVPASFRVSHCNVAGAAGSTLAECQGNDATVIRRALLGLGPGLAAGLCAAPVP
jgi:hypothetical protein